MFKELLRPLPITLILFSSFIIPYLPSNLAPVIDTSFSRLGLTLIPLLVALMSKHPVFDVIITFTTIGLLLDWSHEQLLMNLIKSKKSTINPNEKPHKSNTVVRDLSFIPSNLQSNVIKPLSNRMEREIALPIHSLVSV